MKRILSILLVAVPAAVVALLWTSAPSTAQPVPPPGLRAVQHGSAFTGSGTTAAPLNLTPQSCAGGGSAVAGWGSDGTPTCVATGSIDGTGSAGRAAVWSDADTLTYGGPSVQTVTGTGTLDVTYDGSSTVLRFAGSGNQTLRTLSASVDGQCLNVVKQSGWSLSITDNYASATAGTKVDVYATGSLDFTSGFASRPTGVTLCYISAADSGAGAWVQSSTVYELGTGLTESSGTMSLSIAGASCAAGEHVSAISSTGTGTCTADAGDITSVVAGAGLTGGATSGAATLDVNPGAGLIVNGADQVRLLGSCADGQVLKSGSTGSTWSCADDNDNDHALVTSGVVPMGDGSTQVDSGIGVSGTTVTMPGDTDLSAGTTTVGAFGGQVERYSGGGTINDYPLAADTTTLEITVASTTSLTGMLGGWDGRRVRVRYRGVSASTVDLRQESASSTEANRFSLGGQSSWTYVASAMPEVDCEYDGIVSRWQCEPIGWVRFPSLYSYGAATLNSTATVTGAATFNGDVTIGNASTDTATINATSTFLADGTLGNNASNTWAVNAMMRLSTGIATKSTSGPTASGCGTSPTVVGSRTLGHVTLGTGASGCTLTFEDAFSTTPTCIVQSQLSSERYSYSYTVSTTAITLTTASAGAVYDWICGDHF